MPAAGMDAVAAQYGTDSPVPRRLADTGAMTVPVWSMISPAMTSGPVSSNAACSSEIEKARRTLPGASTLLLGKRWLTTN